MNTILQTLFRPERAFNELKQENKFPVMALVILLILLAVNYILLIPINAKVLELTYSSMPFSEKQLEYTLGFTYKLRYLIVVGSIVTIAITMFVYALLLYTATVIAKPALTYVKSLTLIIYGYFAVLIGELINTGLLYIRGFDVIASPYEISQTGLNLMTAVEKTGAAVYTLLSMINPFQVWFVILLSTGLKVFANIKYIKALFICFIFWLLTVIYPVAAAYFSEMIMQKTGLM